MKRLALAAVAAFGIASCARAPGAPAPCAAPQGTEALLALSAKRYVIVGEIHGTNEAPAAFGEIACAAAEAGPVLVALELEPWRADAVEAYFTSDGDAAARAGLLAAFTPDEAASPPRFPDGRTSAAMLALLERLRALRAGGADVSLAVIVPDPSAYSSGAGAYEAAMAENFMRAAGAHPDARVLALVGNLHAAKARWPQFDYEPMATHLPAEETVALDIAFTDGTAWFCEIGGACGVHEAIGAPEGAPARVELSPEPRYGFEGVLALGAISASPPPE